MTLLERLLSNRISVTWATLWCGWMGPRAYPRLVSVSDASSFATTQIVEMGDSSKEVGLLSALVEGDEVRCEQLLRKLASGGSVHAEERKWRLVMLEELLQGLNRDPLYGTIELLEFWKNWDFPDDGPLGKPKELSKESFGPEGFKHLCLEHSNWIRNETRELQKNSLAEF